LSIFLEQTFPQIAAYMHKCTVIYFGLIADAVGKSKELIDFPLGEDAIDLSAFFLEKYPVLKGLPWKIAVNQELVEGSCLLPTAAEIVLLPPFAGG
jgi:molybdopterin converting factor small subunit